MNRPGRHKHASRFSRSRWVRLLAAGALLLAWGPAAWAETPVRPETLDVLQPLDDLELDRLRGGFDAPGGLKISFGLERVVKINGVLESKTTLNITDLASSERVVSASRIGSDMVQMGPGNSVANTAISGLAPGMGTIVQNSLNDQVIQVITNVNVQMTNAAGMDRLLNSGRLRAGQIKALR